MRMEVRLRWAGRTGAHDVESGLVALGWSCGGADGWFRCLGLWKDDRTGAHDVEGWSVAVGWSCDGAGDGFRCLGLWNDDRSGTHDVGPWSIALGRTYRGAGEVWGRLFCDARSWSRSGETVNAQLTDGGPPLAPELASVSAGPPFGAAVGSTPRVLLCFLRGQSTAASAVQIHIV